MRLIDADALLEKKWLLGTRIGKSWFVVNDTDIDDAPTVDPVKHGRWIPENDEYGDAQYIECSECGEAYCGEYSLEELAQDYKYCPGCGARMNGGADG